MRLRILLLLAALITYGSLYPFHFTVPEGHAAAWARLLGEGSLMTSRADMFGNIALFIPFGLVGVFAVARQSGVLLRIAALLITGSLLALVLQAAQIYVPERNAALADVIWNMVGIALGVAAGMLVGNQQRMQQLRWQAETALPLGLIALWLTAELLPFVPSLDMQSMRTNLKTLLQPTIAPGQLLFHTAGTLIAGRALAALVGEAYSQRWLLMLAGAVAAGKVFIMTRTLDISVLCGLTLGWVGWWLLVRWHEPRRGTALLLLLFGAYAFGAIMPFEFRYVPQPFSWVPFAGLLQGSMLVNSQALLANLCLYAGILGIMRMNGGSMAPASIALAMVVTMFEAMQMFLPGRTPDITDPLLVLLVGMVLSYAPLPALKRRDAAAKPPAPIAHQRPDAVTGKRRHATGFNAVTWGLRLGVLCSVMALAFALLLRLPQLPYNVAELFLGDGAFPFLMIFALALLWVGAGARLVGHYVAASTRPWLALPLLAFGAGVVSLLLLCTSVTQESIADIVGSNNLYWFVVNKDIWGTWARNLFLLLPADLVAFLERPVRYAALYGPGVTFTALMFTAIELRRQNRLVFRRFIPVLLSAALWLWLCKAIAFDWSSTDNLNELITRDGPWGWGGGGYLYALLAVICANAILLARTQLTFSWIAAATGMTLAALPIGWWLLNEGLEQHVHKYDMIFSGVQFLLGADRKNLQSHEVLLLRWSVVQLAGILVIAAGARIAQPIADWAKRRRA